MIDAMMRCLRFIIYDDAMLIYMMLIYTVFTLLIYAYAIYAMMPTLTPFTLYFMILMLMMFYAMF
jgi:hypothetical protein